VNRLLAIIPLAVVLIAAALFGVSLFRPEDAARDPAIGRAFPAIELEPVADYPAFNPASEPARGPALVNVWASWCAPCVIEHPLLMGLAQDGVQIYGVDWQERAEGAGAEFLDQRGNPFAAVGHDDGLGGVELGITGVPESFVIDADGKIVAHIAGALNVTNIERIIRPALEEAAQSAGDDADG
jgi:cytochrome c biogenesis protein CcmG/thiol:disulfide interchange protein DsbE